MGRVHTEHGGALTSSHCASASIHPCFLQTHECPPSFRRTGRIASAHAGHDNTLVPKLAPVVDRHVVMVAPYTLRIVWRSELVPHWELDTVHPDFPDPASAALFATGFGELAPVFLALEDDRIVMPVAEHLELHIHDRGTVDITPRPDTPEGDCYTAWDGTRKRRTPLEQVSRVGLANITIEAWRISHPLAEGANIVGDSEFRHVEFPSIRAMADAGLRGVWQAVGFDVIGPEGRVVVDVGLDERGQLRCSIVSGGALASDEPVLVVLPST
jgi:hypothetical protein